ncbi:MAG: hypothetical protein ABSH32_05460 [Bryobacteraceae bacterium]|jgi:hypothetical protein
MDLSGSVEAPRTIARWEWGATWSAQANWPRSWKIPLMEVK